MGVLRRRKAAEGQDVATRGWSDARPVETVPRGLPVDPEAEARHRIRRQLGWVLLGTVFLAGSIAALFGERGFLDVRRSKKELRALRGDLYAQVETVRRLRNEVRALESSPMAVERIARERLGLVREGELLLLLPPSAGPAGDPPFLSD